MWPYFNVPIESNIRQVWLYILKEHQDKPWKLQMLKAIKDMCKTVWSILNFLKVILGEIYNFLLRNRNHSTDFLQR